MNYVIIEKRKKPIISYKDRERIIRAIRYVDNVVPQTTMDKYESWKNIGFHKMFVGSDWASHPDHKLFLDKTKHNNVEIVYFKYTNGISSSILRQLVEEIEETAT